jgi:hypothetical protein
MIVRYRITTDSRAVVVLTCAWRLVQYIQRYNEYTNFNAVATFRRSEASQNLRKSELGHFIHLPMKMELIEGSETSAISIVTPGNYPKENILHNKELVYI